MRPTIPAIVPPSLATEYTCMIKRIARTAGFSGLLAALLLTLLQSLWVTPLILQAETYESSATGSEHHQHAGDAAAHSHDAGAWAPDDGWQRVLSTTGGNLVVAVGFALILAALYSLHEPRRVSTGALWGLAGFAVFCLVGRHSRRHGGWAGTAGVRPPLAVQGARHRLAGAAAPGWRASASATGEPGPRSTGGPIQTRFLVDQCRLLARAWPAQRLALPSRQPDLMPSPSLLPAFYAGFGCRKGCPADALEQLLRDTLTTHGLRLAQLRGIASIDLKVDEPGLHELARRLDVPLSLFPAAQLCPFEPLLSHRSLVTYQHCGCWGVAESAALALATRARGATGLLVTRQVRAQATLALACGQ